MYIKSQTCHYLPANLEKYFVSIIALEINISMLKRITQSDLKQFPKLEILALLGNDIEHLDKDLFNSNLELTTLFIQNNKLLKNVHPEITLPLKNISSTKFSGNYASCKTITNCFDPLWREMQDSEFSLGETDKNQTRFDNLFMELSKLPETKSGALIKQFDLICAGVMQNKCVAINLAVFSPTTAIRSVKALNGKTADVKHVPEIIADNQDVVFLPTNIAKTFQKLEKLIIINSNLLIINKGALNELNYVKFVNMSGNRINEISTKDFKGVPNIEKLDLSRNQIAVIQSGAFKSNKALVELNLSGNQLTDVNVKSFNQLLKLQTFNLRNNKLEIIDSKLFDSLKALKHVDLRDNICINVDYPANKKTINELKREIDDKCATPIRFCCDLIISTNEDKEEESETICR